MICAFDIGGTKIAAALVSDDRAMTPLGRRDTPVGDYDALLDTLVTLVPDGARRVGISVAAVMGTHGRVTASANIPCLRGQDLAADLAARTRRAVHLVNDADAFGLAEAVCGAGAGHSVVLAAIIGTGIGGSIVVEGRLLSGPGHALGEWGHGPAAAWESGADLPKIRCGCGQLGCVDTLGGARGMERLHTHLHGKTVAAEVILTQWQAGDNEAARTLGVYLDIVSGALANAVNLVAPDIIPLGGGLARNAALVAALDEQLRRRILDRRCGPLLVAAVDGPERGLLGAAIYAQGQHNAL